MNKSEINFRQRKRHSKDVKAKETFTTFENCSGKNARRQETMGFHDVDVPVQVP